MAIHRRANLEIAFDLAGTTGSPALLIQGVGMRGCAWKPQLDGLAAHHRLAVFDNRGVGGSSPADRTLSIEQMAGDALALLDHLGWDRAHVVGHSMGGIVAQELALAHPARVRSLTLMCTFSRGAEAATPSPFMIWVGLRTKLGTKAMRRAAFLEICLAPSDLVGKDRQAVAAQIGAIFGHDLSRTPPVAMRQLAAMRRHDAFARLPALACIPTLVMGGAEDRLALPTCGRRLAAQIPGARYVEVPDAAHGLPITRAAAVNAELLRHFAAADRS